MATAHKIGIESDGQGFDDSRVDTLVTAFREARALLEEEAPKGEAQRSPTDRAEAAIRDLGALTLMLPKRDGGDGMSATGFARVQIEVAKGDPAISWVMQIINGTTWIGSLTSDTLQRALFANGPTTICGAYNPPGKAEKVDGGYLVTGAWPYSSGSRQAKWVQCGCLLSGVDGPSLPGINMAYIPLEQVTIEDSWYVTGMQGTGSDTTVVDKVFVPDHMMVTMDKPFGHVEPGKTLWGAPSDYLPVVPTVRATGLAQLLGGAEAMLELVEEDVLKKPVLTTSYKTKAESQVVVHHVGEVAARLDTARTLLFDATRLLDNKALAHETWSDAERARHKAQCGQIVEAIHWSIERLMFIAGSSAFMLKNPLQRYWRDVHVGLRHITNLPQVSYEIYGRDRLDLKPNITPPGAY